MGKRRSGAGRSTASGMRANSDLIDRRSSAVRREVEAEFLGPAVDLGAGGVHGAGDGGDVTVVEAEEVEAEAAEVKEAQAAEEEELGVWQTQVLQKRLYRSVWTMLADLEELTAPHFNLEQAVLIQTR